MEVDPATTQRDISDNPGLARSLLPPFLFSIICIGLWQFTNYPVFHTVAEMGTVFISLAMLTYMYEMLSTRHSAPSSLLLQPMQLHHPTQ